VERKSKKELQELEKRRNKRCRERKRKRERVEDERDREEWVPEAYETYPARNKTSKFQVGGIELQASVSAMGSACRPALEVNDVADELRPFVSPLAVLLACSHCQPPSTSCMTSSLSLTSSNRQRQRLRGWR